MTSRAPVFILNQNAKREQGRKAQTANIKAARVNSLILTLIFLFLRL
jgi:hypothetical protein